MKRCKIDCFDPSSIDDAIKVVEKLRDSMNGDGLNKLINELGKMGVDYAKVRYQSAWYDGLNDVNVGLSSSDTSSNTYAEVTVRAVGEAVLFIEFGTGIMYPDDAAVRASIESGDEIVGRGEYGKGRGSRMTWVYVDPIHGKVFTHGNPSNACLYEARKHVEERLISTAKEVFKW